MARIHESALPLGGAVLVCMAALTQAACSSEPAKAPVPEAEVPSDIDPVLGFARQQVQKTEENHPDKTLHPTVTIDPGKGGPWKVQDRTNWRSAFFVGTEWLLHEDSGSSEPPANAIARTEDFNEEMTRDQDHDIGFKALLAFGNGYRLTESNDYRARILEGADTLAKRYDMESATSNGAPTTVGAIRSWDFNLGDSTTTWNYPVIADHMMTIEALFLAARLTSDASDRSRWMSIAVNHAQKTADWHIRPDGSTYHVVDFNNDGSLRKFTTYQGKDVGSTWSRGQAWVIHGMTTAYLYTKDDAAQGGHAAAFLEAARKTAGYFVDNLPRAAARSAADRVPYYDFDAASEGAPRDSSAAAIAASALVQLSLIEEISAADRTSYKAQAQAILRQLSGSYLATDSDDESILAMGTTAYSETPPALHAGNVDVGVGLIYGDHYFVQALLRHKAAYGGALGAD